jgi:hypothetical protein
MLYMLAFPNGQAALDGPVPLQCGDALCRISGMSMVSMAMLASMKG